VVACQAENNIPINEERRFHEHRAKEWIRVERYWEGEFPDVKARFLPVLCQHCENAPCEPVCPVYATVHSADGLNLQVYNRCIGTRYCSVNCHWHVRFFNFWEPKWPDSLKNQLNPLVTVRSRGIMEKCTFCVQRINHAEQTATLQGRDVKDGEFTTACAQACPTRAIVFGNLNDTNSEVSKMIAGTNRGYRLLEDLGTNPAVVYLKKVDDHPLPADAPKRFYDVTGSNFVEGAATPGEAP
jgi:molybdopterin-containing oxidoreductase family iron-sulfur binding subunit